MYSSATGTTDQPHCRRRSSLTRLVPGTHPQRKAIPAVNAATGNMARKPMMANERRSSAKGTGLRPQLSRKTSNATSRAGDQRQPHADAVGVLLEGLDHGLRCRSAGQASILKCDRHDEPSPQQEATGQDTEDYAGPEGAAGVGEFVQQAGNSTFHVALHGGIGAGSQHVRFALACLHQGEAVDDRLRRSTVARSAATSSSSRFESTRSICGRCSARTCRADRPSPQSRNDDAGKGGERRTQRLLHDAGPRHHDGGIVCRLQTSVAQASPVPPQRVPSFGTNSMASPCPSAHRMKRSNCEDQRPPTSVGGPG